MPRTRFALPHVERFVDPKTGEAILLRCDCSLGRDHDYADWQRARERRRAAVRAGER
ncbi:hypothetical protein M3147_10600 [Agromyces mediolanus]|uniref:hypothetical protein n=1 Tax=Agromyces mediolanus TaxID=41986 RepID=UPI00203DC179|nr:hypothetical protein [Agromyces mediolanus]MCM3657700.1 hypothetical protein [Agromyces mediolanus]